MIPVFTLKLNHKILPRLVTVGKYDGEHPSLTAATNGNKVFIHNPHSKSRTSTSRLTTTAIDSDINLLNIGQHISALSAGCLDSSSYEDVLVVGSHTHVFAYDIEKNTELFHNEVSDGAHAMLIGSHLPSEEPLVYVGGNCSIVGYNREGEDKFWTVTGDIVYSMTIGDFNLDGSPELLIGSEDYDIRVYHEDELLCELSETDTILSLCHLGHNKFGYALANGTVGVYNGEQRVWRTRSKHYPLMVTNFDVNEDGVDEVVTGWTSGRVDVKALDTGQLLYKDTLPAAIAGIVKADYRQDGKEELICCSVEGEVRGYISADSNTKRENTDEQTLQELNQRKSNLLIELKNFEISRHVSSSVDPQGEISRMDTPVGVIQTGTRITTQFDAIMGTDEQQPHIKLTVETTNDTPIRAVVVFGDGLFDGESFIVHPLVDDIGSKVEVQLFPDKDVTYNLDIKAYLGPSDCSLYHVLCENVILPKFSLYVPCPLNIEPHPFGNVVFNVKERLERIKSFIESHFLYKIGDTATVTSTLLEVSYMSLRTGGPVSIKVEATKNNKVTISTDDMDLAGDIIQSMAEYLNIEDLSSVADFPKHMTDLKEILTKVEEFYKVRETLSADIADHASIIRNLIVRAEDARIMKELKNMKMAYVQLYELNKEIVRGYEIRRNNHLELLDCLKIVNQTVQRAAKLRVGKAKTICTTSCRAAIKDMDQESLVKAILAGSS